MVAWLVALPLALGGSGLAHCYGYGIGAGGGPDHAAMQHHGSHATAADTSLASFFCGTPLFLTLGALLLVALLVRGAQTFRGTEGRSLDLWIFAAVPPTAYLLLHQLFDGPCRERRTVARRVRSRPTFLVGLLLQAPFGVVAYFLARALLGLADRIGRALAAAGARPRLSAVRLALPAGTDREPRPALAFAGAPRGPPSFHSS